MKILQIIQKPQIGGGIYHGAGPTAVSRYEWAINTIKHYEQASQTELPTLLEPVNSASRITPAVRPLYTPLDCTKLKALGVYQMQPLETSLQAFCHVLHAKSLS